MESQGEFISLSNFYWILRNCLSHVTIPNVLNVAKKIIRFTRIKLTRPNSALACVAGAHLQRVNNHYAKFEYEGMKLHTCKQCKHSKGGVDLIMSKFINPKNIIKSAQNVECTHVHCVSNHNV